MLNQDLMQDQYENQKQNQNQDQNQDQISYFERIKNAQEQYYEKHKRNHVFKNAQKIECAKYVSQQMEVERLIQYTVVIVPNTNIIYYNYLIFKTYGSEETHLQLYTHMTNLITHVLQTYDTFELHFNLKTFSISACQRYRALIMSSFDDNQVFTEKMSKLVVYHTPSIVEQITRILYNSVKDLLHKVEYVKTDSDARIAQLFNL